jgi:hypothetical protein
VQGLLFWIKQDLEYRELSANATFNSIVALESKIYAITAEPPLYFFEFSNPFNERKNRTINTSDNAKNNQIIEKEKRIFQINENIKKAQFCQCEYSSQYICLQYKDSLFRDKKETENINNSLPIMQLIPNHNKTKPICSIQSKPTPWSNQIKYFTQSQNPTFKTKYTQPKQTKEPNESKPIQTKALTGENSLKHPSNTFQTPQLKQKSKFTNTFSHTQILKHTKDGKNREDSLMNFTASKICLEKYKRAIRSKKQQQDEEAHQTQEKQKLLGSGSGKNEMIKYTEKCKFESKSKGSKGSRERIRIDRRQIRETAVVLSPCERKCEINERKSKFNAAVANLNAFIHTHRTNNPHKPNKIPQTHHHAFSPIQLHSSNYAYKCTNSSFLYHTSKTNHLYNQNIPNSPFINNNTSPRGLSYTHTNKSPAADSARISSINPPFISLSFPNNTTDDTETSNALLPRIQNVHNSFLSPRIQRKTFSFFQTNNSSISDDIESDEGIQNRDSCPFAISKEVHIDNLAQRKKVQSSFNFAKYANFDMKHHRPKCTQSLDDINVYRNKFNEDNDKLLDLHDLTCQENLQGQSSMSLFKKCCNNSLRKNLIPKFKSSKLQSFWKKKRKSVSIELEQYLLRKSEFIVPFFRYQNLQTKYLYWELDEFSYLIPKEKIVFTKAIQSTLQYFLKRQLIHSFNKIQDYSKEIIFFEHLKYSNVDLICPSSFYSEKKFKARRLQRQSSPEFIYNYEKSIVEK